MSRINEIDRLIDMRLHEAVNTDTLDMQISGIIRLMMRDAIELVAKRLNYPRGIEIKDGVSRSTAHVTARGTTRSDIFWDLGLGGWVDNGKARFVGSVEYGMWDQPLKIDEVVDLRVSASTLADFLLGIMPS